MRSACAVAPQAIQRHLWLITFVQSGTVDVHQAWPCISIFQQLHALDAVHNNRVYRTFGADGREKLHPDHSVRIVIFIAPEIPGQQVAMCLIDGTQRVIRIGSLIHPGVDFLVQIVVKVKGMNLNGLSNVL